MAKNGRVVFARQETSMVAVLNGRPKSARVLPGLVQRKVGVGGGRSGLPFEEEILEAILHRLR